MATDAGVRRRVLVALALSLVIGGMFGLVVAALTPTAYTASSTVLVAGSSSGKVLLDRGPQPLAQQVAASYADVATTPLVLNGVIGQLHLRTTSSELAAQIRTNRSQDSLIRIDVTDRSAIRAARIANAVQQRLVMESASLSPVTAGVTSTPLRGVERAVVPLDPSSTGWSFVVVGLLGGGLLWGLVIAAVLLLRSARTPPSRGLAAPSML